MRVPEAIALYLQAVEGELAPRTHRQYRQTLARLPDVELTALTADALRAWRRALPVAEASANTYLQRARTFLNYAEREGWCARNPARNIGRLAEPARRRLYLSAARLDLMLQVARHPRDRAAICWAQEYLARGGEIAQALVGDVDLEAREARLMVEKKKGVFVEDRLPVSDRLAHELGEWLRVYRGSTGAVLAADAYLFPNIVVRRRGDRSEYRLDPASPMAKPEVVIGYALDAIGVIRKRRGFHDVRRSMARLRYEALCEDDVPDPLGVVKELLHHADRKTTELYIGTTAARSHRNKIMQSASWQRVLPMAEVAETGATGSARVVRLHP